MVSSSRSKKNKYDMTNNNSNISLLQTIIIWQKITNLKYICRRNATNNTDFILLLLKFLLIFDESMHPHVIILTHSQLTMPTVNRCDNI